jgi:hypothetical protein
MSDEWGANPEYYGLERLAPLVLRQYHHAGYGAVPPNVLHLPLGYMRGMLGGESLEAYLPKARRRPPSERSLTWSFVGDVEKQDRREMAAEMRRAFPSCFVGRASPSRMAELYRDSAFVPNGRGNVVLNCFRLYEASLCGALPVVVGAEDEIEREFRYEEDPPWVFARSWPEAVRECARLLGSPEELRARHEAVLLWWERRVHGVRSALHRALRG